jgi:hypothetical protein
LVVGLVDAVPRMSPHRVPRQIFTYEKNFYK